MDNDNKNKKFNFINEKILDKNKNSHGLFRFILFLILCAMIFGVVACLTFYWVKPYIQRNQINDNPNCESRTDIEPEITEPNTITEEITTISVEEAVKKALEQYEIGVDEYMNAYKQLDFIAKSLEKSMSTIVVNKSDNWFNEEKDTKIVTSGVVIKASKEDGIIILTDYESIQDYNSLMVYLRNGKGYKAEVYKSSQMVGIALIKIDSKLVDESVLSGLTVIDMKALQNAQPTNGETVVLMGNPYGMERFMAYGVLTSVANIVDKADIRYEIMTTDIVDSGVKNGFIIDLDGNIIGMIIQNIEPESMKKIVTAVNIEDIILYIDKLVQGKSISYLGIKGQEVTDEVIKNIDNEMPYGIYITSTDQDSPAYNAGIMNGDILVEIEESSVTNIQSYIDILQMHEEGSTIHISVMRKGKDGYQKIVYNVLVKSR